MTLLALVLVPVSSAWADATSLTLTGIARSASGVAFAGVIEITAVADDGAEAAGSRRCFTDGGGTYTFRHLLPGSYRIELLAGTIAVGSHLLRIDHDMRLDLTPDVKALDEQITVTATGVATRLGDTPASVVVVTRRDLQRSGSVTLDGALRQIPGFTLFRRTGSLAANPTTQGVSLRGVGGSGASRVAVLDDGVPLNDAFGGWVYWGRVPREAIDRVEVRRGGSSELFGSAAMSGAINMFRSAERVPSANVDISYGALQTAVASYSISDSRGPWFGALAGESAGSDGYYLLRQSERGSADRPAGSTHHSADLTAGVESASGRYFVRAGFYDESRANGTRLQHNQTDLRQAALGADWRRGATSLTARIFGTDQDYRQSFSSLNLRRDVERTTRRQHVPSSSLGLSTRVSTPLSERLHLVAGFESREVSGSSIERTPTLNGYVTQSAGGRQRTAGLFAEFLLQPSPRLSVTAAIREDFWRNYDAFSRGTTRRELAARSDHSFSPRLTTLFQATDRVALSGSWYRAFREPTLNELYRSFRVGNVITLGNENLGAERLEGIEAGAILKTWDGRGSARATLFSMRVLDTIANVTTGTTPSLITRQRQNLGRTRTDGLELDLSWQSSIWRLSSGYLFSNARVRDSPAAPQLEGLRLPQVPRSQLSVQASIDAGRSGEFAVQARWAGMQFDDDQNRLVLRSYHSIDASYSLPAGRGLRVYLAGENLLDHRYEVGRTPQLTLGPPRIIRGGIQIRLPRGGI